jgi:octopine/nopaline transport system permease protein
MDIAFMFETMKTLLAALPMTLALFSLSVFFGGILALLIVWMRVSGNAAAAAIAKGYIFIFRGSPLLIQMFLIFYGLGQFGFIRYSFLWPALREPFVCAVLSLALCTAGYSAEIFRFGLRAIPPRRSRQRGPSACRAFCSRAASSHRSPFAMRCRPIRPRW